MSTLRIMPGSPVEGAFLSSMEELNGNSPLVKPFTTDVANGPTRFVKVELNTSVANVQEILNTFPIVRAAKKECVRGIIFACFDSLHDAESVVAPILAQAKARMAAIGAASFIQPEEFFHILPGQIDQACHQINRFEGQIVVQVTLPHGSVPSEATGEHCYQAVMKWMNSELGAAHLRAMRLFGPHNIENASGIGHQFRLEVNSRRQADGFVATGGHGVNIVDTPFTATILPYTEIGYQPRPLAYRNPGARTSPRNSVAPNGDLGRQPSNGRHEDRNNTINIAEIERGTDVRTTVMLRNIPNQMTTWDLEDLLKRWTFGRYDFLYLRIDFANMANVGYAFVNFLSPLDILDFKRKLDIFGWPPQANSNKRAALSYATVQGVEALIEKFRNSSVMCEARQCRPRLFISRNDVEENAGLLPQVGMEKVFPMPNNDAKLARSRQNAETQGLYPAHSRDELRRFPYNSPFDRGNPNGAARQITAGADMFPNTNRFRFF